MNFVLIVREPELSGRKARLARASWELHRRAFESVGRVRVVSESAAGDVVHVAFSSRTAVLATWDVLSSFPGVPASAFQVATS